MVLILLTAYNSPYLIACESFDLFFGGELYAMADAFDYAYTLKHDLKFSFVRCPPVELLTESLSLSKLLLHQSYVF